MSSENDFHQYLCRERLSAHLHQKNVGKRGQINSTIFFSGRLISLISIGEVIANNCHPPREVVGHPSFQAIEIRVPALNYCGNEKIRTFAKGSGKAS